MSEKLLDGDFTMIEVMTPLGDPALISQTAFLAEKDETNGWNFWSPNPNTTQKIEIGGEEKMAKRPISDHILTVLGQHLDKIYNLTELTAILESAGHKHTRSMVKDNLDILVKDGKIAKTTTKVEEKDIECFGIVPTPTPATEPIKPKKAKAVA